MRNYMNDRNGSWGVVAGLVALGCLLAGSLSLTLSYRTQLADLKQVIVDRCEIRLPYDYASQDARRAIRDEMIARRADQPSESLDKAIAQLDETLRTPPPGDCREYEYESAPNTREGVTE